MTVTYRMTVTLTAITDMPLLGVLFDVCRIKPVALRRRSHQRGDVCRKTFGVITYRARLARPCAMSPDGPVFIHNPSAHIIDVDVWRIVACILTYSSDVFSTAC